MLLFPWKVAEAGADALKAFKGVPTYTPSEPDAPSGTTQPSGPSSEEIARRERRAAEAKARKAANNRARLQANTDIDRLNADITAARAKKATNVNALDALKGLVGKGEGSHAAVRDNALAALDEALKSKLEQIRTTFDAGVSGLQENLRDNEEAEAESSFANLLNRARERGDLITQALQLGAGESDQLRAQQQALKNWESNQTEANRAFFDTRSSVNASISDLNSSTRTGMMNEELSSNAAKGARWDEFYDAMARSYTDMANLDQNNYLLNAEIDATKQRKKGATGLLEWLDKGKDADDYKAPDTSTKAADPRKFTSDYALRSAEMSSSFWEDPGVSQETEDFEGQELSEGGLNSGRLRGRAQERRRPEGATLRRWS